MKITICKPYPRQRLLAFEFEKRWDLEWLWPVHGHTFVVPSDKETYALFSPRIYYVMENLTASPLLDHSYCLLHPNRLDVQTAEGLPKGEVMKAVDVVLAMLEGIFGQVHFLDEYTIRPPKWPKETSVYSL